MGIFFIKLIQSFFFVTRVMQATYSLHLITANRAHTSYRPTDILDHRSNSSITTHDIDNRNDNICQTLVNRDACAQHSSQSSLVEAQKKGGKVPRSFGLAMKSSIAAA